MPICAQCSYFRRVKPASQLLARAMNQTDSAITGALNKIVEDEQKQRDAEAEFKKAQAIAGREEWATKPVMSDYCSLKEGDGQYLIAEVKNAGGRCPKFNETRPDRHACEDCTHCQHPSGAARDQRREETYVRMTVESSQVEASTSASDNLLNKHREAVGSLKAFELSSAYAAKGVLASMPDYLSYCGKLSRPPDDYVLCVLHNPHNTCSHWEKQGVVSSRIESGKTADVDRLIRQISTHTVAAEQNHTADFVSETLVSGPAPLTQSLADEIVNMYEWMLEVKIPEGIRTVLVAALYQEWTNQNADLIGNLQTWVALFRGSLQEGPEVLAYKREQHQAAFVNDLRADSDHVSSALIALYDAANLPMAAGTPPLTREMADCYLDLSGFISALVQNREWIPFSDEVKAALMQQLASQYPLLTPQEQGWFATLPLEWRKTRAMWHKSSGRDRDKLRKQLLIQHGVVQAGAEHIGQNRPQSSGTTQQRQLHNLQTNTSDISASRLRQQSTTQDMLDDILARQKKEEEDMSAEDPELALQLKLQNQVKTATMLSNMMSMQHQSCMAIAQNLR